MTDKDPSLHNPHHEVFADHDDVGLIRHLVDPKEVKLSKDIGDAGSLSVIGYGYVNDFKFATERGINLKYLDGRLDEVRSHVRDMTQIIKDPKRVLSTYYSTMPESLGHELDPGSVGMLDRLYESSDEVLHDFLMWNTEHVGRIARERQPELDHLKEEFSELMHNAIYNGLPLSGDQLESRLADSRMTFADPINLAYRKAKGTYRLHDRLIQVAITSNKDELRRSGFHELIHLVSGSTIVRDVDADFRDDEMMMSTHVMRDGLADHLGNSAPLWMIEAVTEQLTQVIASGQQIDFSTVSKNDFFKVKTGVYGKDRDALSVMIDDVPVALAAYFEDALPANNGHLPHNTQFWSQLEHEYGRGIHDFTQSYVRPKGRTDLKKFENDLRRLSIARSISETLPPLVDGFDSN